MCLCCLLCLFLSSVFDLREGEGYDANENESREALVSANAALKHNTIKPQNHKTSKPRNLETLKPESQENQTKSPKKHRIKLHERTSSPKPLLPKTLPQISINTPPSHPIPTHPQNSTAINSSHPPVQNPPAFGAGRVGWGPHSAGHHAGERQAGEGWVERGVACRRAGGMGDGNVGGGRAGGSFSLFFRVRGVCPLFVSLIRDLPLSPSLPIPPSRTDSATLFLASFVVRFSNFVFRILFLCGQLDLVKTRQQCDGAGSIVRIIRDVYAQGGYSGLLAGLVTCQPLWICASLSQPPLAPFTLRNRKARHSSRHRD